MSTIKKDKTGYRLKDALSKKNEKYYPCFCLI